MQCPQCAHQNSTTAQFCEECGTKLVRTCRACGQEVSRRAKFCAACGTPLVGHTPASSPVSPETLSAMLDV
jgi:hypothetical protein